MTFIIENPEVVATTPCIFSVDVLQKMVGGRGLKCLKREVINNNDNFSPSFGGHRVKSEVIVLDRGICSR